MNFLPPTDYRNFFNFALCQPIAKSRRYSVESLKQSLYSQGVVPLVYITDRNHPAFQAVLLQFPPIVQDDLDMIVLSIMPITPYLA